MSNVLTYSPSKVSNKANHFVEHCIYDLLRRVLHVDKMFMPVRCLLHFCGLCNQSNGLKCIEKIRIKIRCNVNI